jgi:hypothetical protein
MVWGTFCGTTKSDMVFISGKAKLDSTTYLEIVMESHFVPFLHQYYGELRLWKKLRVEHQMLGC